MGMIQIEKKGLEGVDREEGPEGDDTDREEEGPGEDDRDREVEGPGGDDTDREEAQRRRTWRG